jgi:predicted NBD/HSP70 family sugar kinase
MPLFVGLDIGGTKFLVASANEQGQILKRVQAASPTALGAGLALLHQMIAEVSQNQQIAGMGAAIGGPLDWLTGIVSPLHQPEWREVPLKNIMEERWNCPFWVDVDTNVAALGEYHFSGEKAERFVYITLSTGMGGGFLVNGRIYRGMEGGHPEVGHMAVPLHCSNPTAVQCECGAPDCLEAVVSGNAIRRIYGKPAENLSEIEWAEVTYHFGQGLRNITVLYHPELIVIGGGIASGRGEGWIQQVEQVMRKHVFLVKPPVVRLSRLGYDTALYGAIRAAMIGID